MRSSERLQRRAILLGTTFLAGGLLAGVPAVAQEAMETVTVTGYRASLQDSTNAKRAAVGFSDTVFAEDIGKFPDTNIAEAFNRIPGVTIIREVTGEGLNVQIRGLGTNFTKVMLNNSTIAVASTGRTDAQGQNREVDLNMFPTELFTQLTVSKSPTAEQVEGGASGVVNMRTQRPFDNPGTRIGYNLQGTYGSVPGKVGERGTLIFSTTQGEFGALVGLSAVHNLVRTTGFETIGWAAPRLSAAQCEEAVLLSQTGAGGTPYTLSNASCRSLNRSGQGWDVPGTWNGNTIDAAYLAANNPDLPRNSRTVVTGSGADTSTYTVYSNDALSNALMPRLPRPADQWGVRDRFNGVLSLEYRPLDTLHFYLDAIGGRTVNSEHRTDLMFQVRNSANVPTQVQVDEDGVVTSGVFNNAVMFLEDRPFVEKGDFISINPGMDWQVTEMFRIEAQANMSRSHFFRDYPTIGLFSQPTTVTYTNDGQIPTFSSGADLQNPNTWGWSGQRANIQQEKRYTYTDGYHVDLSYGGEVATLKIGGAYDEVYRNINPRDNTQAWQAAVCGGNPAFWLAAPNSQPACDGVNATHHVAYASPTDGPPVYASSGWWGVTDLNRYGYTAGQPNTWQGSLVPQSAVSNYLVPGAQGYAIVDWPAFAEASNYYQYSTNAPFSGSSNTATQAGSIREQNVGVYAMLSGAVHPGERALKYNIGLRWVQTLQGITGLARIAADPRNTWTITCGPGIYAALTPAGCADGATTTVPAPDGTRYPNTNIFTTVKSTYQAFLPSISLVYEVADDFQIRASVSRTMTRPNPSSMLPGASFSDPSAALANVGNSSLNPFYSNNIDIGGELYTGAEGYIGFAAFRKSLSGFTVTGLTNHVFGDLAAYGILINSLSTSQQAIINANGGNSAPVQFQQQVNAAGLLTINGLEFNMVQPLDFLLEDFGLTGFGVTANVTIVDQRGSGAAPAIAIGVAPYTYNLSAHYENDGVMLRASYNYTASTYNTGSNQNSICIGASCSGGAYQMGAPYDQLDVSSSIKLSKLFGELPSDPELTFDVVNLLQSKQRAYFQWEQAPFTVYEPGYSVLFGIRGSF